MATAKLRWEKQRHNSFWAYSGSIMVGMVCSRVGGKWAWQVDAVNTKWICIGSGCRQDVPSAKAALGRAWSKWCKAAALEARKS